MNNNVKAPLEIELTVFHIQQSVTLKLPGYTDYYRLTGVIIHRQLAKTMGHYTAFICSPKDNRWYYANDAQVYMHVQIRFEFNKHTDTHYGTTVNYRHNYNYVQS